MATPQAPSPVIPGMAVPSVTVTIGTVQPDNENAIFDNNSRPGMETDYQVNNKYKRNTHVLMLPVAAPRGFNGKTCVFVQTAAPTLVWCVDWTALRVGSMPVCPSETPVDKNWVFMGSSELEPACTDVMGDGRAVLYRISGIYYYGYKRVRGNMKGVMAYPRPPWLKNSFDRSVASTPFEQLIADYIGGGGGSVPASPGSPGKKGG